MLDADCLYDSGGAQRCDVTVDVRPTGGPQRIRVGRTSQDVVCIQCFIEPDEVLNITTYAFDVPMGIVVSPGQHNPNIGENVEGVLVLDPGRLRDGRNGEFGPIVCSTDRAISDLTFYSSGECEYIAINIS